MITTIEIDGSHAEHKVRRCMPAQYQLRRGNDVYTIRIDTRHAWGVMGSLMAEGLLPS